MTEEKTPDQVLEEAMEDEEFRKKNKDMGTSDPHVPSQFDPFQPGKQRHFTGREGVPQLSSGKPRDLRDKVDPNDPQTQPGSVRVTKPQDSPGK